MVAVSKYEKEIISEKFPHAHIARTMRQKSDRHHYFCEETPQVMSLIKKLRTYGHDMEKNTAYGDH